MRSQRLPIAHASFMPPDTLPGHEPAFGLIPKDENQPSRGTVTCSCGIFQAEARFRTELDRKFRNHIKSIMDREAERPTNNKGRSKGA